MIDMGYIYLSEHTIAVLATAPTSHRTRYAVLRTFIEHAIVLTKRGI